MQIGFFLQIQYVLILFRLFVSKVTENLCSDFFLEKSITLYFIWRVGGGSRPDTSSLVFIWFVICKSSEQWHLYIHCTGFI